MLPALADIGAVRFFADRMEVQAPHQLSDLYVIRTPGGLDLEPWRLPEGE